jgi:hypothetical protein
MSDMGRYFRAPKKSDTKQWLKVEMLFRAGVYFRSHEFGPLPKTVAEAKAFIEKNRDVLSQRARARDNWRVKAIAELTATEEKRRLARKALKKRKPNQASQRNAMAEPISVFESHSSRG